MREYLRVTPTSEEFDLESVPRTLASLHKLTTTNSSGLREKLNPLHSESPLRFEFLVLCEGEDEPVEFYYGADAHLDTLQNRLRSMYPTTFDIERVDLDLHSRLIHPVEFTREEFVDHLEADQLQYEFSPDERPDLDAEQDESVDYTTTAGDSVADGGIDAHPDRIIEYTDGAVELAPSSALSADEPRMALEKPTVTTEGTILARPTVDATSPVGVQWCGSAARKRDWMTSLAPFTQENNTNRLSTVDQPGNALASLIDHLTEVTSPVAFQVVFERRADWQADADLRKEDLREGRDTFVQRLVGPLLEPDEGLSTPEPSQLSDAVKTRLAAIDAKTPRKSFTANVRAIGLPSGAGDRDELAEQMDALRPVFDPVDGPYYELEGTRLRTSGFRQRTKEKHARKTLQRVLDRDLRTGRGTTRPDLVVSGHELANFAFVPSSEQLTVQGTRGTRAEQQSRNPLSLPNPDRLAQFREGMAIGRALDENGTPQSEPIRVPPKLLTTSYLRAGSTGSGKSTATQQEMLSLDEHVDGPTVLLERKGDGMAEHYLHAHYAKYGDLDDVYYFNAPETLPAVSFFDIRPALSAGRTRADAIQDKAEHFHEIMRLILGEDLHNRAYVANEVLTFLIKALFDREYGQDAFSLEDLIEALSQMSQEKTLPAICAENDHIERSLVQKLQANERTLQETMAAAANRLDKIVEHEHLYQLFTTVPEWDAEAGSYVGNAFDFREFIDGDAVVLFDIGELRAESQHALTMILLSNLWDAVQGRRGHGRSLLGNSTESDAGSDDAIVNMIIEEAAPVATTPLVYKQFIPQGRAFGVSLGLILQYPEQVAQYSASDRAYTELLNNVKTKIIGNIATDAKLAEAMAHESLDPSEFRVRVRRLPDGEWIVQLPNPRFGETGPTPFSLVSLPIPDGHPESDAPLSGTDRQRFEDMAVPRMLRRTHEECSLPGRTNRLAREEVRERLDEIGEDTDEDGAGANGSTAAAGAVDGERHSAVPFFGADGASDETGVSTESETASTTDDTQSTTSANDERDIGRPPMFGATAAEPQEAEESHQSSSAEPAAAGEQTDRTVDAHRQTRDVDEATSDSGETTEASGGESPPEYVSYDADVDHYVCEICGSAYSTSEERKASTCCQFASKDDVYVAARRARDTAETSSELFNRLGTITEHAEESGIEVTIQDFASLDESTDESAAAPNGGTEAPSEHEQGQNPAPSDSTCFKEATTDIPDDTLRAEGVTRDEAAFLGLVLDAMNHQLEEYSLLESMTALEEPFSNLDIETLKEKEFLEQHRSFRQKYYTVLPAGRTFLDRTLDCSPGVGDLGEKTPHKAGVVFLKTWLIQQQADVEQTERYFEYDAETVFDVAGFDAADDLCWVGEVETKSHNLDAAVADYEKLASVDAKAAWAFEDRELGLDVIDALIDADQIDISLTATQQQTVSALRAAISEHNISGLTALNTFRSLKTEVDH